VCAISIMLTDAVDSDMERKAPPPLLYRVCSGSVRTAGVCKITIMLTDVALFELESHVPLTLPAEAATLPSDLSAD